MDAGWRPCGSVISHIYQLDARASGYIRQNGGPSLGVSAGYCRSSSHPQRASSSNSDGPIIRRGLGGVGCAHADRHAQPAGIGDNAWRECRRLFGRRGGDDLLAGTAASVCPSFGCLRGTLAAVAVYALAGKTQGSPCGLHCPG